MKKRLTNFATSGMLILTAFNTIGAGKDVESA